MLATRAALLKVIDEFPRHDKLLVDWFYWFRPGLKSTLNVFLFFSGKIFIKVDRARQQRLMASLAALNVQLLAPRAAGEGDWLQQWSGNHAKICPHKCPVERLFAPCFLICCCFCFLLCLLTTLTGSAGKLMQTGRQIAAQNLPIEWQRFPQTMSKFFYAKKKPRRSQWKALKMCKASIRWRLIVQSVDFISLI